MLVAFVILLVCLVAAFLSGVWVGRGDARPAPTLVAEEAAPAAAAPADEAEPLAFFGGEDGPDAGEAPRGAAVEPRAGTTLAEDLAIEDPDEEVASGAAERPAAPRTPPDEPEPEIEPSRPAPSRTEPSRAEPARPAPTQPAPRPEPAPPAPAAGGDVVIQVFSSRDREQAQAMVAKLVGGGRDAYLSPVEMDGQTMYRVRIGPFSDRARAQQVAEEVRRELKLDTWITPR